MFKPLSLPPAKDFLRWLRPWRLDPFVTQVNHELKLREAYREQIRNVWRLDHTINPEEAFAVLGLLKSELRWKTDLFLPQDPLATIFYSDGMDSLATVEVVLSIESELKRDVPDDFGPTLAGLLKNR